MTKEARVQNEENIVSSINGVVGKLESYMQKNQTVLLSYTIHKIISKCIKDLSMITEIIKLIEKNIGSNHIDINLCNPFLDISPKAKETKVKLQTKKICTGKETTNKIKKQSNEWEKRFANDMPDKRLISKIYKELIQLNVKEPT